MALIKREIKATPTQRNPKVGGIDKALRKYRYWKIFGIKKWNDLIYLTFGEVKNPYGNYKGEMGLLKASDELYMFLRDFDRNPTANDFPEIINAIYRRAWVHLGIKTWNDLLKQVIGDVNKENHKYMGLNGLRRASDQIKAFSQEYGRKPIATDPEMQSITTAIKRKYWISYGIAKWNDLLLHAFGELNKKHGIWIGIEGLERAKEILLQFYKKNQRKPNRRDKRMGGIVKACRRGYWIDFSIQSWSDLIKYVF